MLQMTFVVKVKTKQNQKVKIVGNIPQLGCWLPQKGIDLQYDQIQWTNTQCILIPRDKKFQFKIVKILCNGDVQWETLPNNSNRKHRPLFHCLLFIKWSQTMGKIKNKSVSSYIVQGLPGVMIGNKKSSNTINKKVFNPGHQAQVSSSQSDEEDPYESVISRKKSVDIRASINMQDIKQIYYETTPAQNIYHKQKKIKIYLVINKWVQNSFFSNLQEQIKEITNSNDYYFKWIVRNKFDSKTNTKLFSKKLSFKMIQDQYSTQNQKWDIQDFVDIDKNTFFIWLDLKTALQTQMSSLIKGCLYLPSQNYQQVQANYEALSGYRFVCFDSPQKNQLLFKFLMQKKCLQYSECDKDIQLSYSMNNIFENEQVCVQNIIQQLRYSEQSRKNINEVYNYDKSEALKRILEQNSILIVQSSLIKVDSEFFYSLLDKKYSKRFIIIYHKSQILDNPDLQKFTKQKNICIVFLDFKNFIYLNKTYQPLKKHNEIIQHIKMKAKLNQQLVGGSWSIHNNQFIYRLKKQDQNQNTNRIMQKMIKQFNTIIKQSNYFKIVNKQKSHKFKIIWNIAYRIRLIRTLCRIKFIQQGKIGNFYLISHETSFQQIKEELQLFIRLGYSFLANQSQTKIMNFSYGQDIHDAKYKIN